MDWVMIPLPGDTLVCCVKNERDRDIKEERPATKSLTAWFYEYCLNHPVIHAPPAATSWASCLFAFIHENLK